MDNLKTQLNISEQTLLLMYVGNLESYQGIDLLLDSFALVNQQTDLATLVIIGGDAQDIKKYQQYSAFLGISNKVHFCGPRPTSQLKTYLTQADILVSPRIKGKNTPMKLYSYLDSGKPVLVTDLSTHTQVVSDRVAMLARPDAEHFSQGMLNLIENPQLRLELGIAGQLLIQEKHSYQAFRQKLDDLYDWLKESTFSATTTAPNYQQITVEEITNIV